MASVDIGPLCPTDFKVQLETGAVFEDVARFAAPPMVGHLFENISLGVMFRFVEANCAKVWFCFSFVYCFVSLAYVLSVPFVGPHVVTGIGGRLPP